MTDKVIQFKKWHGLLLAGVTITIIAALAGPALHAEAAQPQTLPTPDGQQIELLYDRLVLASGNQDNRLDFSREVAGTAQEWIDDLKAKEQDVTMLENALSAFNTGVTEAESYHNTATGILSTHTGFDDTGKVTDLKLARETVRTATNNLRQAHLALTQATLDFRSAVRNWREQHQS